MVGSFEKPKLGVLNQIVIGLGEPNFNNDGGVKSPTLVWLKIFVWTFLINCIFIAHPARYCNFVTLVWAFAPDSVFPVFEQIVLLLTDKQYLSLKAELRS